MKNVRGINILIIELYFKVLLIKLGWFWYKNK